MKANVSLRIQTIDRVYCDPFDCFGVDWIFQHAAPSIDSSPAGV